ncbi:hypothetical protein GCM10010168_64500 [Actinoplanes ianthinogenes]|uniref:Uncharacterized protein n=1 Tax=Actinoplanes ianthinogenes TaxID=122358 RepID=A0ABM7LSC8_9ACTN|nr:hypothetical protein [Actinoplanes ianthinogenes]BCJ42172.1 hypothetical protein Aiant_28290 [Actinoplanes ianthinogenes]GGR37263.1 hypothetical protein GCM10010168_64500 [Actinoplanes ianthinogenes]
MTDTSKQLRAGLGLLWRSAVLVAVMAGLVWVGENTAGDCGRGDGAAGGWAVAALLGLVTCPVLLVTGLRRARRTGTWPGVLLGWTAGLLLVGLLLAVEVLHVRGLPSGCLV